ncbi:MAG: MBL fold metallo-hydrolase [Thermotogae bacterium]|nr:MBL fold metallo-hydrolase [Thermotogota bacterium]
MNEIIVLDLKFKFGDTEDHIYPVVLKDKKNLILIDCGYVGFLPVLESAFFEKGLYCKDITHVIITHHDHDHMGCLYDLKKKYPQIEIIASEKESPYISGEKKSLRLEQAEAFQKTLPEDQKAFGIAFCNLLKSVKTVKVDIKVNDGDHFDWIGGCKIISTPGHTPGHISVYSEKYNLIIAGDAIALEKGKPVIANPQFTIDMENAQLSMNNLLGSGAEKIICYHGGILQLK